MKSRTKSEQQKAKSEPERKENRYQIIFSDQIALKASALHSFAHSAFQSRPRSLEFPLKPRSLVGRRLSPRLLSRLLPLEAADFARMRRQTQGCRLRRRLSRRLGRRRREVKDGEMEENRVEQNRIDCRLLSCCFNSIVCLAARPSPSSSSLARSLPILLAGPSLAGDYTRKRRRRCQRFQKQFNSVDNQV